jgi:hypothetical protein
MTPEELWVACDMLTESDQAKAAISKLETVAKDGEAIHIIIMAADIDKAERLKLMSTLTGNLTDVLAGDDAKLAKRAGKLLEACAEATSRLAGNPKKVAPPQPSSQARRLMDTLGQLAESAGVLGSPRPPPTRARTEVSSEGTGRPRRPSDGIFSGSIFDGAGGEDEDW